MKIFLYVNFYAQTFTKFILIFYLYEYNQQLKTASSQRLVHYLINERLCYQVLQDYEKYPDRRGSQQTWMVNKFHETMR